MQHRLAGRVVEARDTFAAKLCARAHLRATGTTVVPDAVRELIDMDRNLEDRMHLYEHPGAVDALLHALDRGKEASTSLAPILRVDVIFFRHYTFIRFNTSVGMMISSRHSRGRRSPIRAVPAGTSPMT